MKFQIKVAFGLKFHWYMRTLNLKFQKTRTKIEVFLSLPCWLSQFWNFKLKVLEYSRNCSLHATLIPTLVKPLLYIYAGNNRFPDTITIYFRFLVPRNSIKNLQDIWHQFWQKNIFCAIPWHQKPSVDLSGFATFLKSEFVCFSPIIFIRIAKTKHYFYFIRQAVILSIFLVIYAQIQNKN